MIPTLSMVCMVITGLVCVWLPVGLFLLTHRRYSLKLPAVLVGAFMFVLFAMILESQVHAIILRPDADGNIALRSQPVLYIIYGCLTAGIFEEGARLLAFNFLKKKFSTKNVGVAISYGIGHGGIEAIVLVGLTMLNNFVFSLTVNLGLADQLEDTAGISEAIASIQDASPYVFLVGGYERIVAFAVQIALSVLVWTAVYRAGKRWMFPAAIGLHALLDLPSAMMQCGVLTNIFAVEALTGLAAAAVVYAVYQCTRQKTHESVSVE